MFIIEGSDNLGKTTAAKSMVELARQAHYSVNSGNQLLKALPVRYPVRYQHMSRQNDGFDYLNDYTEMMSNFAVQDRFHLGGLVWHEGKINAHQLKIIEGRLLSRASVIVVMYASDHDWFKSQNQPTPGKDEMYEFTVRLKGNERFQEIANGAYRAHVDIAYDVSRHGYPNDDVLARWLGYWFDRLFYVTKR